MNLKNILRSFFTIFFIALIADLLALFIMDNILIEILPGITEAIKTMPVKISSIIIGAIIELPRGFVSIAICIIALKIGWNLNSYFRIMIYPATLGFDFLLLSISSSAFSGWQDPYMTTGRIITVLISVGICYLSGIQIVYGKKEKMTFRNIFNYCSSISAIIIWPAALVLTWPLSKNGNLGWKIAKYLWSEHLLTISGIKLTVNGADKINWYKPYVIMSNHQSFLDVPSLLKALPVKPSFIAKKELYKVPILGKGMEKYGVIFIDRDNIGSAIQSLDNAAQQVKNGKTVLIFIEGSRSRVPEIIRPFKKGGFHLAINSGVPILPVRIRGSAEVWPADCKRVNPGDIVVNFGNIIETENLNSENIPELMDKVKNAMENL